MLLRLNFSYDSVALIALLVACASLLIWILWKRVSSVKMGKHSTRMGGNSAAKINTEKEPEKGNEISVSAFAPASTPKNSWLRIQLWLHAEADLETVKDRARRTGDVRQVGQVSGLTLPDGAKVTFRLAPRRMISGGGWFGRRPAMERTVKWHGHPVNVEFPLRFPLFGMKGPIFETVEVFLEDILIGNCMVMLEALQPSEVTIASEFTKIRSGFASYSTKDRAAVIARLQMLERALGWTPFLDIISLRSGDNWESRLYKEIESGEVFLLFWSDNASTSEWVEKEWRHALRTKGLSAIVPIALEMTPPPKELNKLQFADKWTRFMQQAKNGKSA